MSEQPADRIDRAHRRYEQSELRTTSLRERLTSSGRLKPATVDLLALGRPANECHLLSISEALDEQRSER